MSKIVRLTESELVRLVKRMIKESEEDRNTDKLNKDGNMTDAILSHLVYHDKPTKPDEKWHDFFTKGPLVDYVKNKKNKRKETDEDFETIDDDDLEDIPDESTDFPDEDDDIEDYGFDVEDEFGDDDEFQNKMRFRDRVRRNLPGSVGVGGGTRWDKDSEKEWSPIKADDLPLDKFLKSKYNKM